MALTKKKAKTILGEGVIRGKKLTKSQQALFHFVAGGGRPTRLRKK